MAEETFDRIIARGIGVEVRRDVFSDVHDAVRALAKFLEYTQMKCAARDSEASKVREDRAQLGRHGVRRK